MRKAGIFRKTAKQSLDDSIHTARSLADRHEGAVEAYGRLLWKVQSQTDLLRPSDRATDKQSPFNFGLLALALHHADWLRPVKSWRPPLQPAWPLFMSLAHHLFARYPVPAFMTSVWLAPPPGKVLPQHRWFKHLGLGRNIRLAGLPLRFTRAMAHLFSRAPHHFSAIAAVRWAQVRAMGGKEELARAVIATRLGTVLENEDFWETVLRYFVSHTGLDLAQVGPIADFIQHQKFERRECVSSEGVLALQPPPQPGFTMKGRTVTSVLRLVELWHRNLGLDANQPEMTWRRSRIGDFRLVEGSATLGNMRVWTITELLSSRALLGEGRAMRHCVVTYAKRCAQRRTSIWSMQVENQNGRHRVLTVETDLKTKTICQVRGKCNRLSQANEQSVIERWAAQEGLKIAAWRSW